ncbi:MAG: (R)-mandelonitrile lyase [Pseudobdellovibrionaceae bacterium]
MEITQQPEKSLEPEKKVRILNPKEQPSIKGPAENFTGDVTVAMFLQGEEPSQMSAGYVCFECAARSAWHTHPKGQLLVVTEGAGLIQEWGQPIRRIQKGDVIWTPPGVRHWHGAAPESSITHLVLQETLNGKAVEWLEKVTDKEYHSPIE